MSLQEIPMGQKAWAATRQAVKQGYKDYLNCLVQGKNKNGC